MQKELTLEYTKDPSFYSHRHNYGDQKEVPLLFIDLIPKASWLSIFFSPFFFVRFISSEN